MGFFETLKEVITNKPSSLREPKFIKEFSENNVQINELKELLKYADDETAKSINEDIKLCQYGIQGEKNIAYELKNCNMPALILHDLYLKYKEHAAQIDFIVIAQKFILVIECKNMVGDIEVDNKGNFIRSFKSNSGKVYKKEGMYSPITQNEKHVNLLKEIIENEFNSKCNNIVKHCVVLANNKSILNDRFAPKYVKDCVIKYDQLINKMNLLHEENKNGAWLTEESMYKVSEMLMKFNSDARNRYTEKYKEIIITSNKEEKDGLSKDLKESVVEKKDSSIIVEDLYDRLKEYRYNKSVEEKNKPYFIFTNQMLEDIIANKPKTLEELIKIKGFGPKKCESYGKDILEILNKE